MSVKYQEIYSQAYHMQTIEKKRQRENKEARERRNILPYEGPRTRITAEFSSKTMHSRREWTKIFTWLKEKLPTQNSTSSKIILQK